MPRWPKVSLALLFVCTILVLPTFSALGVWPTPPKQAASPAPVAQTATPTESVSKDLRQSKEGTFSRSLLPVVIFKMVDGEMIAAAQGSGFLVRLNKKPLVATAFHVPDFIQKRKGYSAHAIVDGKTCELRLLWKHKTADIALLRPMCKDHPMLEMDPLVLERKTPAIGSPVTLRGYKISKKVVEEAGCERAHDITTCPHEASLVVSMVDATMGKISIVTAIEQLGEYLAAREKKPGLYYDDMYYTEHLVAELPGRGISTVKFEGLSGGALLNANGNVVGVFTSDSVGRFIFVPVREFPSRYPSKSR